MIHALLTLIFISSTILSIIYGDDAIVPNNVAAVEIPANMVTTADLELALRQVHDNLAQLTQELMTTRAEVALAKDEHQAKMDELNQAIQTADESSATKNMVEDIETLQKQFKDLTKIMNQFTHRMTLFEARNEEQTSEFKEQWETLTTSLNADIRQLQEDSQRHAAGSFQSSAIEWLSSTYDHGAQIIGDEFPKARQAMADKVSMIQQMVGEEYPKMQQAMVQKLSILQEQVHGLYHNHAKVYLDQAKPALKATNEQARAHLRYVSTNVLPKAMTIFLTTREAIVVKVEAQVTNETVKPYTQVMVDFILTLLVAPLILLTLLQLLALAQGILRMITYILSCACSCVCCCCCRRRQKSSPTTTTFQSKKIVTKTTKGRKSGSKK